MNNNNITNSNTNDNLEETPNTREDYIITDINNYSKDALRKSHITFHTYIPKTNGNNYYNNYTESTSTNRNFNHNSHYINNNNIANRANINPPVLIDLSNINDDDDDEVYLSCH